MKHVTSFSGTLKNAVISDELRNNIEREVIVYRMNETARMHNEAVNALKITKKEHLKKAMKAKIEALQRTYSWLNKKLDKLNQVTQ